MGDVRRWWEVWLTMPSGAMPKHRYNTPQEAERAAEKFAADGYAGEVHRVERTVIQHYPAKGAES